MIKYTVSKQSNVRCTIFTKQLKSSARVYRKALVLHIGRNVNPPLATHSSAPILALASHSGARLPLFRRMPSSSTAPQLQAERRCARVMFRRSACVEDFIESLLVIQIEKKFFFFALRNLFSNIFFCDIKVFWEVTFGHLFALKKIKIGNWLGKSCKGKLKRNTTIIDFFEKIETK